MEVYCHPVVLVHGWKSNPAIWDGLVIRLEEESVPCWNFDHAAMKDVSLEEISHALRRYISTERDTCGYRGPIDIICHSMGTCIGRYMLEVIDGESRTENVRQLIGIGPPNNGSSLAELFNHPRHGREIIEKLEGVFVPRNYDPKKDIIVQQFRPGSPAMTRLKEAGVRKDIVYRIILAANTTGTESFFPSFGGRTMELNTEGQLETTYSGDGIVPHRDSYLPGAKIDVLPADPQQLGLCPDMYCHINLPRNTEVIDRIMDYLCDPPHVA
ncbi:MAG TPA: acetyltransferase [Methanoregulaceae archaeon]|nr:acetyltransferase [Methanoregulaceae archaeon]